MPIASYTPRAPALPPPEPLAIRPPSDAGVLIDNDVTPFTSLLGYIEGRPWTVEAYYQQVVGETDELKDFDPALPSALQPYVKISQLELRVQSPLESSQDPGTGAVTVSGEAVLYPPFVANVGDIFIATTALAELTLFRVTESTRKTFTKLSCYQIRYEVARYLAAGDPDYLVLEDRVIREEVFVKDRLVQGLSPTLQPKTFKALADLQHAYEALIEDYFRTFYHPNTATLLLPGQTELVYDPFLVDYVAKTAPIHLAPELGQLRRLPNTVFEGFKRPTLWLGLLERDPRLIPQMAEAMRIITVRSFPTQIHVATLAHVGIRWVLYPTVVDLSVYPAKLTPLDVHYTLQTTTYGPGYAAPLEDPDPPLISGVDPTGSYVLSPLFYQKADGLPSLERYVWDYLEGKALDAVLLAQLVTAYPAWRRMEQFYLGPVLWTLLLGAIQGGVS